MSKLLRVTQLDAIQLDNEITNILKSLFDNATKFLPVCFITIYYLSTDFNIYISVNSIIEYFYCDRSHVYIESLHSKSTNYTVLHSILILFINALHMYSTLSNII